ncbi:MAG: hypothetical protein Tsb0020_37010 [Haliangiales bacterium]
MSPKNKGKFGKGKSPVELEDEFVSGVTTVADKIKPHLKLIIGLSVVLTVVMVVYQTYRYLDQRAEAKATTLYREALAAASRPVIPEVESETDGDAADEAGDEAAPVGPQPAKPFTSRELQLEAILTPLETLRDEHGSTDTSKSARLFHAATLYDAGRYDDAIAMYEALLAGGASGELAAIAREGLGYAQEAKALASEDQAARQAGLEQALATFQALAPADGDPRREQALYHEGRILAALGRRDEAVAAYEKALAIDAESPMRYELRQRLALLGAAADE